MLLVNGLKGYIMIVSKKARNKTTIDLTGPQGNAFYLMAFAQKHAKSFGYDSNEILEKMKESDYENLVKVFDFYFGDSVILER